MRGNQDESKQNAVEGKIGTAKTRYGLGKLMTETEQTSENLPDYVIQADWVALAIFLTNMATALRLSAIQAGRFLLSL